MVQTKDKTANKKQAIINNKKAHLNHRCRWTKLNKSKERSLKGDDPQIKDPN